MRTRDFAAAALLSIVSVAATAQDITLPSGASQIVYGGRGAFGGAALLQGPLTGATDRPELVIAAPGTRFDVALGDAFVLIDGAQTVGMTLSEGSEGNAHGGVAFGTSLAMGYIQRTPCAGQADLVVGAPNPYTFGSLSMAFVFGPLGPTASGTDTPRIYFYGPAAWHVGAAVAVGNINADGYDDVFVGASGTSQVFAVLGGPSLTNRDLANGGANVTINGAGIGSVLETGDVNGDGIADLLIGAPSENVVYLITGGRTLPATMNLPADADAVFTGIDADDLAGASLRIADIDADNFNDIIIGAPGGDGPDGARADAGETYILWGSATVASRSLSTADVVVYGMTGSGLGSYIAAGDINRDPLADLVFVSPGAAAGKGEAQVYYGRDRGSLGVDNGTGVRVVDFESESERPDRVIRGESAAWPLRTAIIFDRGGPGARDIVVGAPNATQPSSSGDRLNSGAVYFTTSPSLMMTPSSITQTLVEGQSSSTVVTVANPSAAPITWTVTADQPWLIVSEDIGPSSRAGAGTFSLTRDTSGLTPGTYDGDVTITSTSLHLVQSVTLHVTLTVQAPGTFAPETARTDFNGDGKMDLVWQDDDSGYIAVWTMQGTSLVASELFSPGRVGDTNWKIVGTGDVNGDGKPDIFWQEQTQGWIGVWLMDGRSLLQSTVLSVERVADINWKIAGIMDLNGDGKPDILWREQTQGWVGAWLLDGLMVTSSVALSPERVADTGWKIVANADMNGDGKPDIVWQHSTEGWLAAWLMNGITLIDSVLLSPRMMTDPHWHIVAAGDLNGDGKADLVWQEDTMGWLDAWLMNGITATSSVELSPNRVAQLNWRIVGPK